MVDEALLSLIEAKSNLINLKFKSSIIVISYNNALLKIQF